MVKKNPEAAVIAAIAVIAIVAFHMDANKTDLNPKPTVAMNTKAKLPAQIPSETPVPTDSTDPEETPPPVTLYDVPLEAELQLHIIQVAESYGIDPAIILAMCYQESTYNPASIGDYGASFGLMQVQPKWHSDRMARLGCLDLLDPYQNVIVGTDYLAEQLARYGGDISKALVAYNAGHYNGAITKYALAVLATAEELRGTAYERYR